MTERKHRMRMAVTGAAALAALMLSGCAGTHVGDAWQCPLAQGEVCASVAAADPAVTGAGDPERLATASPLYRPREGAAAAAGNTAPREAESGKDRNCDAGCNPLDWLASLFAAGDGESGRQSETAVSEQPEPAPQIAHPTQAAIAPAAVNESVTPTISPIGANRPAGDALRAPETIGRVWIAPFVDADGVYREASWVRIVIAPAQWRLP